MHKWTNDNTGHNRTIDTGIPPHGKIDHLLITINYVQENGAGNLYKAIALDGHVIPLILRVPEMRDTLRECHWALNEIRAESGYDSPKLRDLLRRIEALTAPTREELDALK